MKKISKFGIAVAIAGTLAISAPLAASANTVFDYGFPTYAKCHAAQIAYQSSFTKITKACYLLAPGPRGGWAFVGETI